MFAPAQDWPVYIIIAGFIALVVYMFIASRKQEKDEKK